MSDAYAAAGVDAGQAHAAVRALVRALDGAPSGRSTRSVLSSGHYASVLRIAENLGIALSTDGVGSKVIVAEQTGRYETIGIDCVAMNVNDVICVGAQPIALLDYLAVEQADAAVAAAIGRGLRAGAQAADIEIPGGEFAQLPELIRGHPSPRGFDLAATCVGLVALDRIIDGSDCRAGDAILGLPSSGVHANGLTLARHALLSADGLALDDRPSPLAGASVADALLEPTVVYVRAVLELLGSEIPVHGLAHITGDGLLNLLRLRAPVGFRIEDPLPVPPVFALIAQHGGVSAAEMHEVFNMGCGFCCVVLAERADEAVALLAAAHPGTRRIGTVTDRPGRVELPQAGLVGDAGGFRAA